MTTSTDERLLATCWTSAGDAASDRSDLRSPLDLRERIEATSAAGFQGIGLLSADLPAAEEKYGLSGIRAMLDDNGIVDLELEGIPYWWDDGPRREESDRIRRALLRAGEVLGARHIKVTPDGDDPPWEPEHWAAKFAELAAQAHDAGTRLGIEFFPWSNIKTLHDGLRLVEDAGHPTAGVVIDMWHIERAHTPVADLASVPPDRIVGVELNDADPQVVGTLFEDTVHRRRNCGEGTFDLSGIIAASLLAAGGWPTARLAVVQPDGRLAAALEANGVSQDVHVAGSLGCALAMLKNRPMRVSRRAWLRPNSSARQQSRAVINAVCREWNVPHLVCSAVMVTDELVDNVIEVARTPSVFKVSLDGDGLRIALRDFQSPRGTQPELKSVERRSLDHAISAISDSFGITPLSDGKAAWVVLKDGDAK